MVAARARGEERSAEISLGLSHAAGEDHEHQLVEGGSPGPAAPSWLLIATATAASAADRDGSLRGSRRASATAGGRMARRGIDADAADRPSLLWHVSFVQALRLHPPPICAMSKRVPGNSSNTCAQAINRVSERGGFDIPTTPTTPETCLSPPSAHIYASGWGPHCWCPLRLPNLRPISGPAHVLPLHVLPASLSAYSTHRRIYCRL